MKSPPNGRAADDYEPSYEPGHEQEPTIEKGKDSFNNLWKVLALVVAAGVGIGAAASASYVVYPYQITVSGTFVSSDGGRAMVVDFYECSALVYATCPDPGQQPVQYCIADPVMNMTDYCTEFNGDAHPGYYVVQLRNGENYVMKGLMINSVGGYDKVCTVTVVLHPALKTPNSTQNFLC